LVGVFAEAAVLSEASALRLVGRDSAKSVDSNYLGGSTVAHMQFSRFLAIKKVNQLKLLVSIPNSVAFK